MLIIPMLTYVKDEETDHAEDCDDKGPKSHCAKMEAKGAMKRGGQAFKMC